MKNNIINHISLSFDAISENVIEEIESSSHEDLVESEVDVIESDEIEKDDEDIKDIMNSSEQNEDTQCDYSVRSCFRCRLPG